MTQSVLDILEIPFDGDVVDPGRQIFVEMFVVRRILLENDGATRQQVRETVGRHSTIHVDLVFVLP